MRGINSIEVYNFKSYRGKRLIGPFKNFTAVVGPNGSGKSNVMDAITFVLGVAAGKIRADKLKELINSTAVLEGETTAYVEMTYQPSDETKEMRFRRAIRVSGGGGDASAATAETIYSVNGSTMSKKAYEAALESIGIIARASNFLVPQNEVESVAQKTPMQLTQYLELISGSAELQKDYEEAAELAKKAENEFLQAFRQKQNISKEHKQVREQAAEAKRFRELLEELAAVRLESYLFNLYHTDKELEQARSGLEQVVSQLKERQSDTAKAAAEQAEHSQKMAQMRRELASAEATKVAHSKRLHELRPKLVGLEEQKRFLSEKLSSFASTESELKRDIVDHEKVLRGLQEDLKSVERAKADFEMELKSEQGKEMKLAEDQLVEYRRLKALSDQETAADRERLDQLKRQSALLHEKAAGIEAELASLQETRKNLADAQKKTSTRMEMLERLHKDSATMLESDSKMLDEMVRTQAQEESRREELKRLIEEAKRQMDAAAVDKSHLEREMKMKECVRSLKVLYGDKVRGRLITLCQPSQAQYQRAMETVLGKNIDAIVVEDEATAFSCLQYLKDQRIGVATFLPLKTLRVTPVNEMLRRQLRGNFRLATDIILSEESDRRAVEYACAGALVCKDLSEARHFAFTDPNTREFRQKIVTLDGSVLHRNGNMTGGVRGGPGSGLGGRAEEMNLARLQEESKQWFNELSRLATSHRQADSITRLRHKVEATQGKLKHLTMDLENLRKEAERQKTKAAGLDDTINKKTAALDKAKVDAASKAGDVAEAEAKLQEAVDERFKDFTRKAKVKSVRDFEIHKVSAVAAQMERRVALSAQVSRLTSQIQYESGRDMQAPLSALREKVDKVKKEIASVENSLTKLQTDIAKEEEFKKEAEAKVADRESALTRAQTAFKELREEVQRAEREVVRVEKNIAAAQLQVNKVSSAKMELIRKCRLEHVDLPLASSSSSSASKRLSGKRGRGDSASAQKRRRGHPEGKRGGGMEDVEEEEEEDEEEEEEEESKRGLASRLGVSRGRLMGAGSDDSKHGSEASQLSQSQSPEDDEDVVLDYSTLPLDKQQCPVADIPKVRGAYADRQAELTAAADRMSPHSNVDEREQDVATRLRTNREAFEAKQRAQKLATEEFEAIKTARRARFMKAYESILKSIDGIYKMLTASGADQPGGRAYLSLENNEEPYLYGVNYTVTPPQKHYREMGSLSGGEKTMAALALLFAIHQYRAAPFFVLDEVDAALDSANVAKVATYIRARANEGLQCIVISLKDSLYSRADGLVGVFRDRENKTSGVLTFSLEDYADYAIGV